MKEKVKKEKCKASESGLTKKEIASIFDCVEACIKASEEQKLNGNNEGNMCNLYSYFFNSVMGRKKILEKFTCLKQNNYDVCKTAAKFKKENSLHKIANVNSFLLPARIIDGSFVPVKLKEEEKIPYELGF